ncbi:DnaB-like helicase C-terminal domain-containing protein [Streptomyces sp. NBC_01176]|uniref:DnaB-like helicase C-terminal domain-containing protein n=1 Tax=Streptomyces sp. NBC_01176 TaxID=2903760 RepID=UPI0038678966|nr:DnaB helicase C-terminal domain-containing protein [Streptomyces sp. NBC_01176]
MTSQPTPSRDAGRRLATLGDALGDVITPGSAPGLSFGLAALDAATGGLHPGRLVLVAAPPQVGGSLIGLAAARHTALALNHRVLYAASGPNRADITRRIIAAEAGGDYARLKTGTLTPHEQEVVQRLRNAPLLIDDGSDLTAEAIAETVPVAGELALVVVDRLQRARNPRLPMSGEHLPAASQVLRELARTQHIPVLAVVDTDDPAIVNLLDADVILTLTAHPDGETNVTVAERDLGIIGHARLRPDLAHARFLDTTATAHATTAAAGAPAGGDTFPDTMGNDTDRELAAAALPFTSGALQGLPAEATHLLAALRTALAAGNIKDLDELRVPLRALAAAGLRLPDHAEGCRLAAALHAHNAPAPAVTPAPTPAAAPAPASAVDAPVAEDNDEAERDDDDGLVSGDEEDEPEGAVFPALRILKDSVERSKMHPIPVIRKDDRDGGPWPLISEDMDGEPRWVHPDVTSTRVAHERNGKRVRRDQLDVPASFGDGLMCLIDRNGSFPSACSAVPLSPNRLLHTGPLEAFDKSKAGIYLIEIPAWTRTRTCRTRWGVSSSGPTSRDGCG